jgi:hypothetical protein
MKSRIHPLRSPYILGAIIVAGIALLHHVPGTLSMMKDGGLQRAIDYHRTLPVFAARPLTTKTIETVSTLFSIGEPVAFEVVNFGLMWLSGLLLYRLCLRWGAKHEGALFALTAYLLSFSNLFAFFPPIYAYDEPLQYSLFFMGLLCLPKPNWALQPIPNSAWVQWVAPQHTVPAFIGLGATCAFGVFFGLSLLGRETGLVLIPAILAVYIRANKQDKTATLSNFNLILGLGLAAALLYAWKIYWVQHHPDAQAEGGLWQWSERLSNLKQNFLDRAFIVETLCAIYLVLAIPMLWIWPLLRARMGLLVGILGAVVINTALVLLMAKAREARLFALPLLMVWPLLAQLVPKNTAWKRFQPTGVLPIVLMLFNAAFSFFGYTSTCAADNDNFIREYIFLYNTIIIIVFMEFIKKMRSKNTF